MHLYNGHATISHPYALLSQQERLSVNDTLDIALQLARAVCHMHAAADGCVVHGDLKPR